MIPTILFSYACLVIFSALKDGLSLRAHGVGWSSWHLFGWGAKVVPMAVNLFLLWWFDAGVFLLILCAFFASLHDPVYRWAEKNRKKFTGSDLPPGWFLRIQKIWAWLPWV